MDSRDELIAATRALAARTGKLALTQRRFLAETGFTAPRIRRDFGSWRALRAAAGLAGADAAHDSDEALLAAMGDAFVAAGGVGGAAEFARNFRYPMSALTARFGPWPYALLRFEGWARTHARDFPHFEALARARRLAGRGAGTRRRARAARPCGEPLRLGALLHAPINENGVILAFGMFADRLGFAIESVAAAFPDCIAKRRIAAERWRTVRIEFEYKSRNFRDHGHDPAGCDLIVCWTHDWADCPLEVIELKTALAGVG